MADKINIDPISDFDPNIKQINGPINVARLEGNIHGIKKIIYLFMDFHLELQDQTECNNIFSHDVHLYFAENFYKLNGSPIVYDFFLEIYPTASYARKNRFIPQKQIYIWQVSKLFYKVFKYDEKRNQVKMPDIFKNVRLHYIDIRDYLKSHIIDKIDDIVGKIKYLGNDYFNTDNMEIILVDLMNIKKEIDKIIELLKYSNEEVINRTTIIKEKDPNIVDETAMQQIIYKLKYRYNDDNIKEILNGVLENIIKKFGSYSTFIHDSIKEIKQYHTTFIKQNARNKIDSIPAKIYDRLNVIAEVLYQESISTFVGLMDIYFLRRFLDKDYITNAIVYTGILHSTTYIEILVKYFNFKITHVAWAKISDTNRLTNEIRNLSEDEIFDIFSGTPIYQCSDITHFPENFL